MGKGSRPRPMQISRQEYERRWDDCFGAKGPEQKIVTCDMTVGGATQRFITVAPGVETDLIQALAVAKDGEIVAILKQDNEANHIGDQNATPTEE